MYNKLYIIMASLTAKALPTILQSKTIYTLGIYHVFPQTPFCLIRIIEMERIPLTIIMRPNNEIISKRDCN